MKKSILYLSIAIIALASFISPTQAQDREFIRKVIKEEGGCRNVAITKTNGDVALFGQNGWAATDNTPKKLCDELDRLTDKGEYIDDVQLTESGDWLILYGNNGVIYDGITESLEKKLIEYNKDNEVINSVTFNDNGDWIIISDDHYNTSSKRIDDIIEDGMDDLGQVLAACITDDAIVIIYKDGYTINGNVPKSLDRELNKSYNYYRVKVAGDAWFISDGKENYVYDM